MKGREFKRIWGKPWDYIYLLAIEQKKFKEMASHFKKHKITKHWELQVRDCELCVKLLDIIQEKDIYYNDWFNACNFAKNDIKTFNKYVNLNNATRFHVYIDNDNKFLYENSKIWLRQVKALYLYNKIRSYRIHTWWD